MMTVFRRFARDESGATALEYTLIAVLMAAALIAAWPPFYNAFLATWTNAGATIKSAVQ